MPKTKNDEPSPLIVALLNRVEAMFDCGAGRTGELAEFLRPGDAKGETRVGEWIRSRYRTPNGETALRMTEWAAMKTLEISKSKKLSAAYRKAFKAVTAKRA